MKKLLTIFFVVALSLTFVLPAFAADDHTCDHDATTIESLQHCVLHAIEMGHITSPAVARSLLAEVNAAQKAYDNGQTDVAIGILHVFVEEVHAASGIAIDPEHAHHLAMHAENVITALGG